ncbi:hypothetical protein Alches_25960 [Alicyclobacillus hesperidum subsp. aegles]|nr:hypothetical protein AAC03nite_32800 [Alicyclobacillus acidoterrestris]GLG02555.1 hypothetical protein Alches_25960 [Alicyclobacillus hesperidum subsp. aegles]
MESLAACGFPGRYQTTRIAVFAHPYDDSQVARVTGLQGAGYKCLAFAGLRVVAFKGVRRFLPFDAG